MSKHILDRERSQDGTRAERFAEIERKNAPEGSGKAAKTLHQRPQGESGARAEQYARIERGDEA